MAALYKDFPKFLITALQFKVRKDPAATYYKDPRFNYALSFDDIFYYSRLFLPYPSEYRVPSPRKATPEQNLKFAEFLVKSYEKHSYPELEGYVNTELAHQEPDKKVEELNQDLAKLPKDLPPSQPTPATSPKVRTQKPPPQIKKKAEEEAAETEEVPKEQVAQPKEQPQPAQPPQPTPPPSMPQMPSTPGIPVSRGVRQTVTRRPGFLRRGLGGLGRRIAPGVGSLGNFALSNGGKLLNSGANAIQRLGSLRSGAAANLKKAASRRVIWIVLLFLLGGGLITGLLPGGVLNPTGTSFTGGGDIATCKFYRGGDKISGLKIGNPALASLINEVSIKVGVPPIIIAGILRVETASALSSTDVTYIANDYDAHTSGLAYGMMQFTPATFEGTFNRNKGELLSLFGKDSFTTNIDPQDNMAPTNVFRIYSIKDSLIAATFKVRVDKQSINKDGPWDEQTVKKIAERYYGVNADGTTNYPGWDLSTQNYGNDLWKSFSECSTKSPSLEPIADASCPIPGGKIGCASFGKPYSVNGFSEACAPDSSGNGGHCSNIYQSRVGICLKREEGGNLIRTAKSIDVSAGSKAGDPVYLPTINGQSLDWEYVGPVSAGSNFGWIRLFHSVNAKDGIWSIHFVHVNEGNPSLRIGDIVKSGQVGATILNPWIPGDPWPHAHITAGLNVEDSLVNLQDYSPNWKFPDRELGMCTK